MDRNWKEAGRAAARVGDEVITLHDLVLNVKEQLKKNPPGRDLSRQELNMVAKSVLAGLIERTLIAQEAKRELKNPKQLDRLYEAADKYWREEELPPMMRRSHGRQRSPAQAEAHRVRPIPRGSSTRAIVRSSSPRCSSSRSSPSGKRSSSPTCSSTITSI